MPISFLLLTAAGAALGQPVVAIELEKPRFPSGEEISATVRNEGGVAIFVPACETMQLETFDADSGRWIPEQNRVCPETKAAIALDEGTHTLTTSLEVDRFTVVRLVLAYGVGCRPGYSLEAAGCVEFSAAISGNITVSPASD